MAAEDLVLARLQGSAALAAIVGTRIYGGRAPQNAAVPFVVWKRISGADDHALDGRTAVRRGRFSVDCYAADGAYEVTVAMGEAVATALQAHSPALELELEALQDFYEEDTPKRFRRMLDFASLELTG